MKTKLARARDGDQRAVKQVVEALRPRITRMAAYYANRCGYDREDLLQEAWIGLLEALPDINLEIGTPEQYLIQRAKWRLLDQIKRARVRQCLPLHEAALESMSEDMQTSGLDQAVVSEFAGQLKTVQQLILCYLLGGLTWREAGKLLGCSSANIAYHVRQIRRSYEKWVDEQEELQAA